MNNATIIQSRISYDSPIRQTVVLIVDGAPTVWTREGAGRGANGAWVSDLPTFATAEQVVGNPKTVDLSDFDVQQVRGGIKPDSLLQRIVRKVSDQTAMTGVAVEPIFDTAYNGGVVPSTNIAPPVVVAPPVPEVVLPEPPVVQPVVQVVREPVRQPEPVMGYSTLIRPQPTDTDIASYVPRTLDDIPEERVMDWARANQKAVMVLGHAGVGKTTSARRYASLRGLPLAVVESNQSLDEEQVQGALMPTVDGHFAWADSALAEAIRQPSVVLINEATRMSPKANAMFLRILQERELHMTRSPNREVIPIHPECLIIADANWGYRGTTAPDQAFLDRFSITVEYKYDRDIESKFIPSTSLLDVAFSIRDQYELGEFRSVFSTRVLKAFVELSKEFGWNFARSNLLLSMNPEDRGGIANTLDLNGSNICDELGIAFPVSA
jgi:hypothetical protein